MLFGEGFVGLLLLGVWLFALFDAITSDPAAVRNLPKGLWIILVLILPDVGAILWFIAGRPVVARQPGGLPYKGNRGGLPPAPPRHARGGPVAPDDDPEFLRSLRASNTEHERMLDTWEADLRKREEELRRGDGRERPDGGPQPA